VAPALQAILRRSIPETERVRPAEAERLRAERRGLFFKPAAGYGGRAAYRGDKVTKRVWAEILAGDYIAQALVPPGARVSGTSDAPQIFKFDIRCYTYGGEMQWTAARVYQGRLPIFAPLAGALRLCTHSRRRHLLHQIALTLLNRVWQSE
jgi:hypothetical protein